MVVIISVDKENPTVVAGNTTTVTITNYSELENVTVTGSNDSFGTVTHTDGIITITGVAEGSFNVTIKADNATADKVLTTTVTAASKINIETDKGSISGQVETNTTLTITNYADLTNVTTESENTDIFTIGMPNSNGECVVNLLTIGTSNITITADNGNTKTLNVEVTAKTIPQLSTIITVKNYTDLADGEDATILSAMEAANTNAQGKAKIKTNDKVGNTTFEPINLEEYEGTVDTTYTIAPKNIHTWLTPEKLNLGEQPNDSIAQAEAQEVCDQIPEIVGKVTIGEPLNGKVHVSANDSTLTGEDDFIYTLPLSIGLTTTELDQLENNGTDTISATVIAKNSGLTTDDFNIKENSNTDTGAICVGKGKYSNEVQVTYSLTPISNVITTTTLGIIMFDDNSKILGSVVAQKVLDNNTDTEVTINDFNIKNEDVHYNLDNNTGDAVAYGVYKYGNQVNLTFELDPNDANRPTSKKSLKTKPKK